MSDTFESAGVCLLASTGKSLRLEITNSHHVFTEVFYVGLNDLKEVLNGKKKTATIVRVNSEKEVE